MYTFLSHPLMGKWPGRVFRAHMFKCHQANKNQSAAFDTEVGKYPKKTLDLSVAEHVNHTEDAR